MVILLSFVHSYTAQVRVIASYMKWNRQEYSQTTGNMHNHGNLILLKSLHKLLVLFYMLISLLNHIQPSIRTSWPLYSVYASVQEEEPSLEMFRSSVSCHSIGLPSVYFARRASICTDRQNGKGIILHELSSLLQYFYTLKPSFVCMPYNAN